MRAVKVRYTVRPEYAEENKANIRRVMDKLRADPIPGMQYASFVLDDGQTFVHLNLAEDQETLSKLGELAEFEEFRTALQASRPVTPPKAENLDLVGANFELASRNEV